MRSFLGAFSPRTFQIKWLLEHRKQSSMCKTQLVLAALLGEQAAGQEAGSAVILGRALSKDVPVELGIRAHIIAVMRMQTRTLFWRHFLASRLPARRQALRSFLGAVSPRTSRKSLEFELTANWAPALTLFRMAVCTYCAARLRSVSQVAESSLFFVAG